MQGRAATMDHPCLEALWKNSQYPSHAYVWKTGGERVEPDLESWARAYDTVQKVIESKKRLGFAPIAL